MIRVTLDTNTVNDDGLARITAATAGHEVECLWTTATEWEQRGTPYARSGHALVEAIAPFGFGPFGEGPFGGTPKGFKTSPGRFEEVLSIISAGGFPPPRSRSGLTSAQRRQFYDAMIFETHIGHERDAFVTDDEKAFIRHGRREALKALGQTRIMTVDEFCAWAAAGFPR